MKKYSIILLTIVIVLFVLSATIYASDEGKVYKWRAVSHSMAGTTKYDQVMVKFCERVKEASNGRLIIEPYAAGVLFPVFDSFDALKNNIVQMSMVFSGYWAGIDPFFAISGNHPGSPLTDFSECMYREEEAAPLKEKVYAKYGIKYLGCFDWAEPEPLMSMVAVNKIEDFKGLKIRTSGPGANFFKRLGASVVSLSAPEIYTSLKLGTIDLAEYTGWAENSEMGLNEVTKYIILPSLHMGSNEDKALCVNPKAWNELPDDIKAIVIACLGEAKYRSAYLYTSMNRKAKAEKWDGVEIITLPEEEVVKGRKIGLEVERWYAEQNPECAEYVAIEARVLHELGYIDEAKDLGYSEQ